MLYEGNSTYTHGWVQWSKSVPALRKGEVPNLYLDMCSIIVWVDDVSVSGREKKELEHFVQPKNSLEFF
jgi:hypothetical protein